MRSPRAWNAVTFTLALKMIHFGASTIAAPAAPLLARFCRIALVVLLVTPSFVARAEGLRAGDVAAPIDIELINGKVIAARHLEGKVVLHYFWATWCPICHQDMGKLQKIYRALHSRGFEIIAHSLDDDPGIVTEYWRERGYTFPVAMRSAEAREIFGPIRGTPTFFLIDRKGALRLTRLGVLPEGELEARIAALL